MPEITYSNAKHARHSSSSTVNQETYKNRHEPFLKFWTLLARGERPGGGNRRPTSDVIKKYDNFKAALSHDQLLKFDEFSQGWKRPGIMAMDNAGNPSALAHWFIETAVHWGMSLEQVDKEVFEASRLSDDQRKEWIGFFGEYERKVEHDRQVIKQRHLRFIRDMKDQETPENI